MSGRLVIPLDDAQGERVAYCGRSLSGTNVPVSVFAGLQEIGSTVQLPPGGGERRTRGGSGRRLFRPHEGTLVGYAVGANVLFKTLEKCNPQTTPSRSQT